MNFALSEKLRIAVCVSGAGRSLSNLILCQKELPFDVCLIVSSSPDAGANQIARLHNIPLVVLDFSKKNQASLIESLNCLLVQHRIDLIVLAGFLKLMPVPENWRGKIINIHPALLPLHGGKGMFGRRVHEAVVHSGERVSGATVHYADEEYDRGKIIAQVAVNVSLDDSPETLEKKVFAAECRLLPAVISALARGSLPDKDIARLNDQGVFE